MLQKLSIKTGLTKTEIRVIGFLSITLIAGFSYVNFFLPHDNSGYKKFDYSEQDSIFLSSGSSEDSIEFSEASSTEGKVNPAEVLGLDKKQKPVFQIKKLPAEKSINLNIAGLDLIMMLPGIGKKTALRLLELRMKLGKFSSFDDLLLVKGIGTAKLEKIKKYSYIGEKK